MKAFRKRYVIKSFTWFLIKVYLVTVFLPTFFYSFTSGPSVPETTSFEPVDTTDFVNLATGDLAYNTPLFEVPGPSGGYPLSLSYHAGITPQEDATWVGLGWTLNPGAINRNVSGLADDWDKQSGYERIFWEGGSSSSFSATVSLLGQPGFSAGISHSEDTYLGVSQSSFVSVGGFTQTYTKNTSNGVTTSSSSTSYSIGLGHGLTLNSTLSGNSVSTNMNSGVMEGLEALANNGIDLKSVKNYLISTKSPVSFKSDRRKEGKLNVIETGFNITIPTPWKFSVNLSNSVRRYWIDEFTNNSSYGSLYFPRNGNQITNYDNTEFDVYSIKRPSVEGIRISPTQDKEGSFVDYDSYNVLSQGLSGTFRPYSYRSYIHFKNLKDDDDKYIVKNYPLGYDNLKPNFRFENDFSNRFLYQHNANSYSHNFTSNSTSGSLSFSFNGQITTGENGNDGYNNSTNELVGSSRIVYYTNAELLDITSSNAPRKNGLIDYKNIQRINNKLIGAFSITNSSGVTYHYALPVLSQNEVSYVGRLDIKGKHLYTSTTRPAQYAYTWLLTAITGPDFVDTNLDGLLDKGDLGYWVSFDYGIFSERYFWRTPSEGLGKDLDQRFDTFSRGSKQMYYLNAISTSTHTALFVKGFRKDGKGVNELYSIFDSSKPRGVDHGGHEPTSTGKLPANQLKLNEIILIDNNSFTGSINDFLSELTNASHNFLPSRNTELTNSASNKHREVIDSLDLVYTSNSNLKNSIAIKSIKFNYDYSLCKGTPNSYLDKFTSILQGKSATTSTAKDGKLTLKSLQVCGKNRQSIIPPTIYNYDSDDLMVGRLIKEGFLIFLDYSIKVSDEVRSKVQVGDLIEINDNGTSVYGYIDEIDPGNELELTLIGLNKRVNSSGDVSFKISKNPPYIKDFWDSWGYFKSDFKDLGSESLNRATTELSARNLDVWCLRSIESPLGSTIRINYGSDKYNTVLKSFSNIPIKSIKNIATGVTEIELYQNASEYGLSVGSVIEYAIMNRTQIKRDIPNTEGNRFFTCDGVNYENIYVWETVKSSFLESGRTITSINGRKIRLPSNYKDYIGYGPGLIIQSASNSADNGPSFRIDDGVPSHQSNPPTSWYKPSSQTEFIGGEILFDNSSYSPNGGGIRVESIIIEGLESSKAIYYSYDDGVTSYEPRGYSVPIKKLSGTISKCMEENEDYAIDNYKKQFTEERVYYKYFDLFLNQRELPGPGVQYGKVQVREANINDGEIFYIPGYKQYEFENFKPSLVNINNFSSTFNNPNQSYTGVYSSNFSNLVNRPSVSGLNINSLVTDVGGKITNFSALYGQLKSVKVFGGGNNLLSETKNVYLHDNKTLEQYATELSSKFKNQGVIEEIFVGGKIIKLPLNPSQDNYQLVGLFSRRTTFPSVLIGTSSIDYKSGKSNYEENLAFDFYSGDVIKNLVRGTNDYNYLIEKKPAYRVDAYSQGMGLAIFGGKNMLTQPAGESEFKVDENLNKLGLVLSTVQTWSDQIDVRFPGQSPLQTVKQSKVWRKASSYSFVGTDEDILLPDGLYPIQNFEEFTAWTPNVTLSNKWQKQNQITLYDVNSHVLEVKDLNGNYLARKMNFDNSSTLASAGNSQYKEFAFSGAEENPKVDFSGKLSFGGEVYFNGIRTNAKAHTGQSSLLTNSPATKAFTYTFEPNLGIYHVSYWTSSENNTSVKFQYNNGPVLIAETKKIGVANGWYLMEASINVSQNLGTLNVWCESSVANTYFDDFRIHPKGSAMQSYVYNAWGELTHILDNNNLYTEYRYDEMGRLKSTFKETINQTYGVNGIVKVSEVDYNYGKTKSNSVDIQVSKSGPSGYVSPSGQVSVSIKGSKTFYFGNTCPSINTLIKIKIDNKEYAYSPTAKNYVLPSGTEVTISGNILSFRNVSSSHKIEGVFGPLTFIPPTEPGRISCVTDNQGCFTGQYAYAYYDSCGQEGPVQISYSIPSDLQHLINPTQCANLQGSNCIEN